MEFVGLGVLVGGVWLEGCILAIRRCYYCIEIFALGWLFLRDVAVFAWLENVVELSVLSIYTVCLGFVPWLYLEVRALILSILLITYRLFRTLHDSQNF